MPDQSVRVISCGIERQLLRSLRKSRRSEGEQGKEKSKPWIPNDEVHSEGAMGKEEDRFFKAAASLWSPTFA